VEVDRGFGAAMFDHTSWLLVRDPANLVISRLSMSSKLPQLALLGLS
jgi:hypothetical protein